MNITIAIIGVIIGIIGVIIWVLATRFYDYMKDCTSIDCFEEKYRSKLNEIELLRWEHREVLSACEYKDQQITKLKKEIDNLKEIEKSSIELIDAMDEDFKKPKKHYQYRKIKALKGWKNGITKWNIYSGRETVVDGIKKYRIKGDNGAYYNINRNNFTIVWKK